MQSKTIAKGFASFVCQLVIWLPVQLICSQPIAGNESVLNSSEGSFSAWHISSVPGWFKNPPQIAFGGFRVTACDPGRPHVSRKRYRVEGERIVERTESRESSFRLENPEMGAIGVLIKRMETKRVYKSFSIGLAWSSEEEESLDVVPEWHKEEQLNSLFLAAELSVASPEGNLWNLLMEDPIGETGYQSGLLIINGLRTIRVVPSISGDPREEIAGLPAEGFEFYEGDTSLASLQFLKNGLWKRDSVIRIRRDLDPELQLVLSASVVLLLQDVF